MHLHFKFHENPAQFFKNAKKAILNQGFSSWKKTKTSLEILCLYLLNMLNFKKITLIATEI